MDYTKQMKNNGEDWENIIPLKYHSYQELVEKLKTEPKVHSISTALKGLDDIVGGFEAGRLYTLSAPTKQGKTTFAQTLMFNLAQKKIGSLFFSYEMGWQEITSKFQEMDEKVNKQSPTPLPMLLPIELHKGGGELHYQWMFELIAKAKEEEKISLVVIDHLHFLIPLKDYKNFSIIIGGVVREIKKMAVALNIPIILIAHTKKVDDDRQPTANDIRDSSLILQESDVVMMMYRVPNDKLSQRKQTARDIDLTPSYSNKAILSVELDRRKGASGKILLEHDGVMFTENDNTDLVNKISKEW